MSFKALCPQRQVSLCDVMHSILHEQPQRYTTGGTSPDSYTIHLFHKYPELQYRIEKRLMFMNESDNSAVWSVRKLRISTFAQQIQYQIIVFRRICDWNLALASARAKLETLGCCGERRRWDIINAAAASEGRHLFQAQWPWTHVRWEHPT